MRTHWKLLLPPPAAVAGLWGGFVYGGLVQWLNPRFDLAAVVCFAALVLGLVWVPGAMLVQLVLWLRAPGESKSALRASFLGWVLAWLLLLGGFAVVPYSQGWP